MRRVDPPACFDVLDVFEGFASLAKRSPTLDGAVPVRVAQACVPLLEGNAFGFQVHLNRTLRVSRRLGVLRLAEDGPRDLERLHAAALPRLVAHGFVGREAPWHRALRRGFFWSEGATLPGRRPTLRLFTGLLVRPHPGTWLRLSTAANRRHTLFDVAEMVVPDDGAFVPLALKMTLPATGLERVRLEGEVACLAPIRPDVRVEACTLAEAPELGRAHVAFYDQTYFDTKRGEVTGKYRRLVAQEPDEESPAPASCRIVVAGPARFDIVRDASFLTAVGPALEERPEQARRLESAVFRNHPAFTALYDGHTLALEYDKRALATAARAVERAWTQALGEAFVKDHRGALLYLTKYFTPHPPGEPHFFVKPWAFTRTPPGWSSLLEGFHGDGYDVLRGVVSTDVFHATPAVFHVRREGTPIRVRDGAPLLRVLPIPRGLLSAGFRRVSLPDAL